MDTLFSNISVITMDERMQVLTNAFVGINDGKIVHLSKKAPEEKPQQIIDGTGMVLLPGLINCHTQVEQTLLRGYADDCSEEVRLGQKLYPRLEQMDDRSAKASALLGIAECLRLGVTSISDMATHLNAVAEAVNESGIKANLAPELTMVMEEDDFDFDTYPDCMKFVKAAQDWHNHDDGRIKIDAGIQAEYTSAPAMWNAVSEFAINNKLGMHLNLCQFDWEVEDCEDRTGLTPAEMLDCSDVFVAPTQAAHCNYLKAADAALLGKHKVSCVCCPMEDQKLAAGQTPVLTLVKSGMNVALGTGSAASCGSLDLLEQARAAALQAKLKSGDPESLTAEAALLMATSCGARAQGRQAECGMIKLGMDADLIALDFTQPYLIPTHNLISNTVYAASGRDVCMTMVRGKILYAGGKFPTIDLPAVMTELAEYAMDQVFTEKDKKGEDEEEQD